MSLYRENTAQSNTNKLNKKELNTDLSNTYPIKSYQKECEPNHTTYLAFADVLIEAEKSGVNIEALNCTVTADELLMINKAIKIKLYFVASNAT